MSTAKRNWVTGFYWIGVLMTVACVALVAAANTELASRLERSRFPLAWVFAGTAILAFLAAELCHHASHPRGVEKLETTNHPVVGPPKEVAGPALGDPAASSLGS
jgi:hypothetical protein